jgi:hypothetical protein
MANRTMQRTGDRPDVRTTDRTWGEWLALTFGVVYAIVGIAGFFVTNGGSFTAQNTNDTLLGFEVNNLHNVVHLLIGAALIIAFMSGRLATMYTAAVIGVVYLALGLIGPAITDTDANILSLNGPDHWLHILSGIGLLLAAWGCRVDRDRLGNRTTDQYKYDR